MHPASDTLPAECPFDTPKSAFHSHDFKRKAGYSVGDDETATEAPDNELDADFVEQAEYIPPADFLALSAEHPDEELIIRKLSTAGAKLLVGPRGCGKTTLMLKAYYGLLSSDVPTSFAIYVNFKLSLQLEPLYANTPNAAYWFRQWLVLMIYKGIHTAIADSGHIKAPPSLPLLPIVNEAVRQLEAGTVETLEDTSTYATEALCEIITKLLSLNNLTRCILFLDDAAHAFSPRQQRDFFDFFRQIKSKDISPKAAIYPGITTLSPSFHVGHDAEQVDVWVRPDRREYLEFMRSLAGRRFRGNLPAQIFADPAILQFLAYASFGVPRSFLNMLRLVYQDISKSNGRSTIDRRKLLEIAKQGRESSHNVYESLTSKLPAYREFVAAGRELYQSLIQSLKDFNKERSENNQAVEIGLKKPLPAEMIKVLGFFQYAGLLMPGGDNSRGVKGVFELYVVHYGDLITENAVIGRRAKSLQSFVTAFSSQTHQAWPRISPDTLVTPDRITQLFRLSLPQCQNCSAPRVSEDARFCPSCGAQLKTASLYNDLVKQDISVLPLSKKIVGRIKQGSTIRTIKDVLLDSDRTKLRGVRYIGSIRASRIVHYAEEYLA